MLLKVLNNKIENAYKYYGNNQNKFHKEMDELFKCGIDNPTITKILLNNYASQKNQEVSNILKNTILLTDYNSTTFCNVMPFVKTFLIANNTDLKNVQANNLYNDSSLDSLESKKQFEKKWKDLYPKTGYTREQLIKANRISSSEQVTKKASWLEKICSILPTNNFYKIYPKTIQVRYKLISDKQIVENKVTQKAKGWFKRLSYNMLINNGYSFKK